jgi:hypothetical protein
MTKYMYQILKTLNCNIFSVYGWLIDAVGISDGVVSTML